MRTCENIYEISVNLREIVMFSFILHVPIKWKATTCECIVQYDLKLHHIKSSYKIYIWYSTVLEF
jgi:hypothetical protein